MQWLPIMEGSPWWWALRQHPLAHHILRDLLHQMLSALAALQQANITHRSHVPPPLSHRLQSSLEHDPCHCLMWNVFVTVWGIILPYYLDTLA